MVPPLDEGVDVTDEVVGSTDGMGLATMGACTCAWVVDEEDGTDDARSDGIGNTCGVNDGAATAGVAIVTGATGAMHATIGAVFSLSPLACVIDGMIVIDCARANDETDGSGDGVVVRNTGVVERWLLVTVAVAVVASLAMVTVGSFIMVM